MKKQYGFDCKCAACMSGQDFDNFLCTQSGCEGALAAQQGGDQQMDKEPQSQLSGKAPETGSSAALRCLRCGQLVTNCSCTCARFADVVVYLVHGQDAFG